MKYIPRLLIGLLILLISTEALLRRLDPLGIRYLEDIGNLFGHMESDYTLPPGHYDLDTFTVTVNGDRTRRVPDTPSQATCTLVAIGDSVTFGHGVGNQETWVNLLAREFPDIRFINTGTNGFNSHAIREMQGRWLTEANGFIYFIIQNDTDPNVPSLERDRFYPYISAYWIVLQSRLTGNPVASSPDIPDTFWDDLTAIQEAAPTLLFVDNPDFAAPIQARFPEDTILIDPYTHTNSLADPHPDSEGHQEIAAAMLPGVRDAVQRWCEKRVSPS